jgi:hypothetical protein
VFTRVFPPCAGPENCAHLYLTGKAAIDSVMRGRFGARQGAMKMRISGIAACIFAVAAFAPCQAMSAAGSATAAAHASAQAVVKTAKATKSKKPDQPPQQAYVTFYWSKGSEGPSMFSVFREKLLISMDGKAAGKLTQGEFLNIPVDPGHHTFGYERVAISSEGETKHEIDIAPGQTAYYEIVDKNEAGFMHVIVPKEAAPDQAKAEIATLKAPLQAATKEAVIGGAAATGARRNWRVAGAGCSGGIRSRSADGQARQERGRAAACSAELCHVLLAACEIGGHGVP